MDKVSFGNINNIQTVSPELQKRIESEENFTAIDKEKLKQDTVQLTQNATNTVKENFIFRALKNIGVEDPKKTLKSVALTAVTVIGVAVFGNRFSNKAADLGLKVDDLVAKSDFIKKVSGGMKNAKDSVGKFLRGHFKFIDDIADTLKNRKVGPHNGFAKSSASGPKFQFASAVMESMQGIFYGKTKGIAGELADKISKAGGGKLSVKKLDKEIIRKLVSGDVDTLTKDNELIKKLNLTDDIADWLVNQVKGCKNSSKKIVENMVGTGEAADDAFKKIFDDNAEDRVKFVNGFVDDIKKYIGKDGNKATEAELLDFFKKIQKGDKGFEECKDIKMIHGMDSWFTTNWIDDLGKKIFKDKWKKNVSRANVGSTLIKYSATSGKLAKTGLGKFIQGFPTLFSESVSNYVCDMAFINAIVLPSFIELFNNVQDAPKEQKGATLANEFIGGVGNFTLVMPAAAGITYGIASLRNLQGKSIISKALKGVGKLFGMGLPGKGGKLKPNAFARFGGGAFRFIMIMFALSPLISKPITAVVQKIFGKPYNPEEAKQAKELEEQKKQIIPELGITQGELMEKIEKNPTALEKLQTNSELVKEMERNPKILLDILDNKEVVIQKPKPKDPNVILSPANKNIIANRTNMQGAQALNKATKQPTPSVGNNENTTENVDTATYIPSSQFTAKTSNLSAEQQSKYDALMARSDKVLKEAEKFI